MDIKKAIDLLSKEVPGRIVTGYWERPEGFILNTEAIEAMQNMTVPGQYIITENGEVYGTNPVRSKLLLSDMVKL